jgi:polyisoprenoid-binding protein YceI
MKHISLLLIALFTLANGFSQKTYATKSAQVKFFSHTLAEDIEAINNQAESKLIEKTGQVMFSLLIKGFRFENELMQEHFNGADYMNSTKFPKGEFKGTIANIAAVNFTKDGSYNVTANGNLTIKGITKKVTTKGTVTVAKGKVSTKSIFKINIKDFGVDGGKEIAKQLEITVTAKYE